MRHLATDLSVAYRRDFKENPRRFYSDWLSLELYISCGELVWGAGGAEAAPQQQALSGVHERGRVARPSPRPEGGGRGPIRSPPATYAQQFEGKGCEYPVSGSLAARRADARIFGRWYAGNWLV